MKEYRTKLGEEKGTSKSGPTGVKKLSLTVMTQEGQWTQGRKEIKLMDVQDAMLKSLGMVWGGRWEGASGWGMHVDVWQNQ